MEVYEQDGTAPTVEPEPVSGSIDYGDFTLTPEEAQRLADYLRDELLVHEQDTADFHAELLLWRSYVDPKHRNKDFPWAGAANVFVPIPRMVVDGTKAAIKQSITRQRRIFSAIIPTNPPAELVPEGMADDLKRAAEDFAHKVAVDPARLGLLRVLDEGTEEMLVAGFMPLKLTVESDTRTVTTLGGAERTVTFRSGPRLLVAPVGTFVWPSGLWRTVQEMPWVGNWEDLTPGALRTRSVAPWSYRNVEEVIALGSTIPRDDASQQKQHTLGMTPSGPCLRTYYISLVWDVHGDGRFHDIVVTYNRDANLLHRVIYNPGGDATKDWEIETTSPRSGVVFGRGIVEPIAQACLAINTAVNQTFDAQTLSNAPSILYPEDGNAAGVMASGFFPGMPIPYKEDKAEIDVLKFPPPDAISFQMVQFFLSIVGRVTRMGAERMGDVSSGSRVPASLGLTMTQSGNELIDEMIDRLRVTLGRVVSRAIVLYHKHDPGIFVRILGEERGALLSNAIEWCIANQKSVQETLGLALTASSVTRSIELERQNSIAVIQLSFNWYRQVIELAQMYVQVAGQPQVQALLLDVIKSSQEQLRRAVELSDVPDAAQVIPDLAARLSALGAPMGAPTAGAGAPAPPPAGAPLPAPQDLLGMLGAAAMGGQS